MNSNLFKSTEFYRRRYHNFATVLILPLVLLAIFALLFALFATKEVTLTAVGEITPTRVVASVQSSSDNPILENHLKDNEAVKQGDLLLRYSEAMESAQKQAIETQLDSYRQQKAGLETLKASLQQGTSLFEEGDSSAYANTYQNYLSQSSDIQLGIAKSNTEVSNQAAIADNTIAAINSQITSIQDKVRDYQELYVAIAGGSSLPSGNPHQALYQNYLRQKQGNPDSDSLTSQYLTQVTSAISELESSAASLEIQKAGTGSPTVYDGSATVKVEALKTHFIQAADQQLVTVESQITDLENQLSQADVQLSNNQLTAPEDGILHLNDSYKGKNLMPKGTEIAQIYPAIAQNQEVLISYYVPSSYLSSLKEGQTVRLSLDKIGNQATVISGQIKSIDSSATETKQGSLFKVTAKAVLSEKDSRIVRYGLEGRVTSIIARKTYFDYYKDRLLHVQD